jgi:hypothetical protein
MSEPLKKYLIASLLPLLMTAGSVLAAAADGQDAQRSASATTRLKLLSTRISGNTRRTMTLKFQAEPGAICKITVSQPDAVRKKDLLQKTAGADGLVTWNLHIARTFEGAELPVTVTSSLNGRENRLEEKLSVPAIVYRDNYDVM